MNSAGSKNTFNFISLYFLNCSFSYIPKSIRYLPQKHLFLVIISILFAILFTYTQAAFASDEATTPESIPHYWATTQHFSWFLDTDLLPENFIFLLNGRKINAKDVNAKKYKRMLHVRFQLQPGSNSIIVKKVRFDSVQRTLDNDKNNTIINLEVFFAPSYESGIVPEDNLAVYFHTKKGEEPCLPCHRLAAKRADVRPKDITKQICFPCHSHKFDNFKYPHKPAAKQWRCLICHQYKAVETDLSPDEPLKFMVNQENGVAPICFKCHVKKKQHINKLKFVHGPIGMGACNLCHNPHGSQREHLLQNEISSLCISCHQFQKKLKAQVVHQVIKTKGCTACHDPHGSMHKFQLITGLNDLCYKCHPDLFKLKDNHPIQNHPVYGPVDPSNSDKKFTCDSCHNPHSSEYASLLPVADTMMICAKCHKSSG